MRKIGICCLGLLFSLCSYAQVQREYHLISVEKIENKAYYFTALLREFGEALIPQHYYKIFFLST